MLTLAAQLTGQGPQDIAQAMQQMAADFHHQVPAHLLIEIDRPVDELVISVRELMTPPDHGEQLMLLLSGEHPGALQDALNFLADELRGGEVDMTGRQGPDWEAHLCEYGE